jgi:hypothetical protein
MGDQVAAHYKCFDLKEHTRRASLRVLVPQWSPRWLLASVDLSAGRCLPIAWSIAHVDRRCP